MKANKKTLMAVKRYLQNQEGWDLDEVINTRISDTNMLKLGDTSISADECTIVWGDKKDGDDKPHYWNSNPDKFLEDLYGIKLLRYQKIILKQMLQIVK